MTSIHRYAALIVLMCASSAALAAFPGLLLLAHGGNHSHAAGEAGGTWNRNVETIATALDATTPTAVAFGMADPASVQAAVDALEARGVDTILAVPLFVSSHSPIIGNLRYILGLQPTLAATSRLKHLDRVETAATVHFGAAMDDHPLISEILLQRAQEAAQTPPPRTTVVLIAHGPNDPNENRRWLDDLAAHAAYVQTRGGFRAVRYLTHRNDAPPAVKHEARTALRAAVAEAAQGGGAVVVPVLLSAGGIEQQIEADLEGLDYRFAGPLLPHPNVQAWIEAQFAALAAANAADESVHPRAPEAAPRE